MKKIGILLRKDETYHLNKELVEWLEEYEMLPIGIVSDKLEDMIEVTKFCDGIILQGGKDYTEVELEYVCYLHKCDIPTLGICLGMQMMSVAINGALGHLENKNHQSQNKYVHEVDIIKNTKLHDIVKCEIISVNSRHVDYVKYTALTISGYSKDRLIEVVEDMNHRFFLGVQWHPESIRDIHSNNLLKAFKNAL